MAAGARRAVVLLSGGLDSATTLGIALGEGFEAHALTVRYGQRHAEEIERATVLAQRLGAASHRVVDCDLRFARSALIGGGVPVPKHRDDAEITRGIPPTYVPARNTVLLALALSLAEAIEARDLFIGVNAVDYSGYPDCRPEFLEAFENLARLATRAGVEGSGIQLHAPLLDWSKSRIVLKALELGIDPGETLSCYDPVPGGVPCGACDACLLRERGFREAGVPDPARGRKKG